MWYILLHLKHTYNSVICTYINIYKQLLIMYMYRLQSLTLSFPKGQESKPKVAKGPDHRLFKVCPTCRCGYRGKPIQLLTTATACLCRILCMTNCYCCPFPSQLLPHLSSAVVVLHLQLLPISPTPAHSPHNLPCPSQMKLDELPLYK